MEGLIVVALGLAFAGTALAIKTAEARRVVAVWEQEAREVGLRGITIQGLYMPRLWALTDDGVAVRVRRDSSGVNAATEVWLIAAEVLPAGLELRRESLGTAFEKRVSCPDIETGDEGFDAKVYVQASSVVVVALLDHANRSAIRSLLEAGGRIDSDQLTVTLRGDAAAPRLLGRRLRELIEVVRGLRMPPDPAAKLADNARHDPVPGVRRRNLELLIERFLRRPATVEILRAALADPDPGVRLLAARPLGSEGVPMLVELALSRDSPEPVALAAIRAAGAAIGSEHAGTLLTRGLGERRSELAVAAIEALGQCHDESAVRRLAGVLAGADPRLAAVAAGALATCQGLLAEPALTVILARGAREVRVAAAAALADVGTVAAVPALRAVVAAHPADIGLRRAVEAAVGTIQERSQGAAPGQLSLATGTAGELALSDDEHGRVTVADDTTSPTSVSRTRSGSGATQ